MKLTEEQKHGHRYAMRLLAALAMEHGLRFLAADDAVRKTIEEDIKIVRAGEEFEIEERYKQAKERKVSYTPPGLLLQGANALLYLAKHKGYPPSSLIQRVLYFPTEAGFLVSSAKRVWEEYGKEQHAERQWQEENLLPLERRLFQEWGEAGVLEDIKKLKF